MKPSRKTNWHFISLNSIHTSYASIESLSGLGLDTPVLITSWSGSVPSGPQHSWVCEGLTQGPTQNTKGNKERKVHWLVTTVISDSLLKWFSSLNPHWPVVVASLQLYQPPLLAATLCHSLDNPLKTGKMVCCVNTHHYVLSTLSFIYQKDAFLYIYYLLVIRVITPIEEDEQTDIFIFENIRGWQGW